MSEPYLEPPDMYEICGHCGGEGAIETAEPHHDDPYYARIDKCVKCNGSGYVQLTGAQPR